MVGDRARRARRAAARPRRAAREEARRRAERAERRRDARAARAPASAPPFASRRSGPSRSRTPSSGGAVARVEQRARLARLREPLARPPAARPRRAGPRPRAAAPPGVRAQPARRCDEVGPVEPRERLPRRPGTTWWYSSGLAASDPVRATEASSPTTPRPPKGRPRWTTTSSPKRSSRPRATSIGAARARSSRRSTREDRRAAEAVGAVLPAIERGGRRARALPPGRRPLVQRRRGHERPDRRPRRRPRSRRPSATRATACRRSSRAATPRCAARSRGRRGRRARGAPRARASCELLPGRRGGRDLRERPHAVRARPRSRRRARVGARRIAITCDPGSPLAARRRDRDRAVRRARGDRRLDAHEGRPRPEDGAAPALDRGDGAARARRGEPDDEPRARRRASSSGARSAS